MHESLADITRAWHGGGWVLWPLGAISLLCWMFVLRGAIAGRANRLAANSAAGAASLGAKVAPLFGLIGTVGGLIETFNALHASSFDLATGIGRALISTQAGLLVALPLLFAARWFKMGPRLRTTQTTQVST